MGVTRDSSADAMAEALAAPLPSTQRAEPTEAAMRRLWAQVANIRTATERSLRVAQLHGGMQRVPHSERQMAREAQQRCITLLAHLDDIERLAVSGGGG
jgi:hypothetical protein